ncbi:MAG: hypothetical protein M9962_00445 [Oligoflexia bacterium]|nr:hypothetical protein [Oligoflexia bacterium]
MIYVNEDQLKEVNYLVSSSANGIHLLFDEKTLLRVAPYINSNERNERVTKAEQLLEQVILRKSITEKKAFLATLEPEIYDDVAKVFLSIVQNSAEEHQGFRH